MRRKLVVANWKMHGNLERNKLLLQKIVAGVGDLGNADFAVCVPHPYLFQAQQQLTGTNVAWGAQNVHQAEMGAYTGAVSAWMVADFGCTYAIIGHSERRGQFRETNESAARSMKMAIKAGLTPIYCMGETLDEYEVGVTEAVVASQLDGVLNIVGIKLLSKVVFAYEPVWAIGTGKTATPGQAQSVHEFIRARVARHDLDVAAGMRILYGGSVKAANAAQLFVMPDIDGGLIGSASLAADEFVAICQAANQASGSKRRV
jgi:triosephosphate isomerase (TIM)